jgi:multicomponent Na+:H+ antiporter subunit D
MSGAWLPALILVSSMLTGVVIFLLPEDRVRLRSLLNLVGAVTKVVLVTVMLLGVYGGKAYETRFALLPGRDLVLVADPLALLFLTLSAGLWLLTTIYAIGYLEGSPNRSRFFGFFSLCVTASAGVAMAGDLLTFVVFFELLTLATWPLVVHRGTPESIRAGRVYLAYTLCGGLALLLGAALLEVHAGGSAFGDVGPVAALAAEDPWAMRGLFFLLVAGLGVKAALIPLHGWLPRAMVAPAPVSALLHAVAVVKAGAFGIVRVIMDVFGLATITDLGVGVVLAVLASVTIVYGSVLALRQDGLKARLAYSTVSQLSLITLGVALGSPLAVLGGLVHLVHQGLLKITLFMCAGNFSENLGVHRVSEMAGIGRRMPLSMGAFSVAALGMIGLPPMAGFITKFVLAWGGIESGHPWVILVLLASSLLNAAYFLPVLYSAWFREPGPDSPVRGHYLHRPTAWLLLPPLTTAALGLAAGAFAQFDLSPLGWVRLTLALRGAPQ